MAFALDETFADTSSDNEKTTSIFVYDWINTIQKCAIISNALFSPLIAVGTPSNPAVRARRADAAQHHNCPITPCDRECSLSAMAHDSCATRKPSCRGTGKTIHPNTLQANNMPHSQPVDSHRVRVFRRTLHRFLHGPNNDLRPMCDKKDLRCTDCVSPGQALRLPTQ